MSSRLTHELSQLAAMTRRERIHDREAIKELTMAVGYAYLAKSHAKCWNQIRKHLQAFVDVTCTTGHRELCERSTKIIEMFDGNDMTDAA